MVVACVTYMGSAAPSAGTPGGECKIAFDAAADSTAADFLAAALSELNLGRGGDQAPLDPAQLTILYKNASATQLELDERIGGDCVDYYDRGRSGKSLVDERGEKLFVCSRDNSDASSQNELWSIRTRIRSGISHFWKPPPPSSTAPLADGAKIRWFHFQDPVTIEVHPAYKVVPGFEFAVVVDHDGELLSSSDARTGTDDYLAFSVISTFKHMSTVCSRDVIFASVFFFKAVKTWYFAPRILKHSCFRGVHLSLVRLKLGVAVSLIFFSEVVVEVLMRMRAILLYVYVDEHFPSGVQIEHSPEKLRVVLVLIEREHARL